VATNAPTEIVERTLVSTAFNGIDLIVSAETPPHREKPAPDVYAHACRELGVDPANAVAFDDSPVGVLAARRAGLFVIHVPSRDARICDADLRVNNLTDPGLLRLLGAE
jgi:beta-phosphoglucomutase-like phosphatase (HAD superfamily)